MTNEKKRSGPWRRTAALAVAVGVAALATACSSSSSSSANTTADGSSAIQKMDAYVSCLTSHGATGVSVTSNGDLKVSENGTNFEGNGGIPTNASNMPASLESAAKACQSLSPSQGAPSAAQQKQDLQQLLKYVQCMRSHGEPDFPDPTSSGQLRISFSKSNANSGVNPQSPVYQKANAACVSLDPSLAQLPAAP